MVSVLNIEYAKNFIKNEARITDRRELMIATYKESFPENDWTNLSDDDVYSLSSKRRHASGKAISLCRSAVQDISHVTAASIIDELDEARDMAKDQQNPATMIQATMSKAKTAGLIVNKIENKNQTNISIEAQIKTVPQYFLEKLAGIGATLPPADDDVIDIK